MIDLIIELNNMVTFTAFETVVCWAFGIITGMGLGTARASCLMTGAR